MSEHTISHIARASLLVCACAAATALMSACGGGGGGGSTASAGGGTSAASYTGTVTGLGSIVVNGVRFATTGASTEDGDDPRNPVASGFALGSTVLVQGTIDNTTGAGQASSIAVLGGVRGQVSAANAAAGTLTVAGQAIKVDANTVFEGTGGVFTLNSIESAVNASTAVYVEVYGVPDATNTILATRIEQKASLAAGHATVGTVSALDTSAKTFTLTLRSGVVVTVDYTSATTLPASATLSNGSKVRVFTSTDPGAAANASTLTATKLVIKREPSSGLTKLRGVVTAKSGNTWTVNGTAVDVSQSPRLDDLANLAAVSVGDVIKVKGSIVSGVLIASEVESDGHEGNIGGGRVKLYGTVSNRTPASGPNLATFDVQGVTVSLANGSSLSLPANGTYVEVSAGLQAGVLTASRIGIEGDGATTARAFEVYGTAPCTNGAADLSGIFTLTLRNGGSTVQVNASQARVSTENGVSLSTVVNNASCMVEVKGLSSAGTINASKVEVKARQ